MKDGRKLREDKNRGMRGEMGGRQEKNRGTREEMGGREEKNRGTRDDSESSDRE